MLPISAWPSGPVSITVKEDRLNLTDRQEGKLRLESKFCLESLLSIYVGSHLAILNNALQMHVK